MNADGVLSAFIGIYLLSLAIARSFSHLARGQFTVSESDCVLCGYRVVRQLQGCATYVIIPTQSTAIIFMLTKTSKIDKIATVMFLLAV